MTATLPKKRPPTASGATTTEKWWYLEKLPGEDGNPLSGWVREDELITPRLHPWDWEGFDFIKETSTLGDQYVCQLSADGVLDDEETLNYTRDEVPANAPVLKGVVEDRKRRTARARSLHATHAIGIHDHARMRTQHRVNGSLVATDTTSPYGFTWDSSQMAAGIATLVATAYDAAGNAGASAAVSVTIRGPSRGSGLE